MQNQSSERFNGDGKMRCEKVKYKSQDEAIKNLHTVKNVFGCKSEKIPIRCYECSKCKGWHLTSREIITEKAKAVKLKQKDKWQSLIQSQQEKEKLILKRIEYSEYLYGEKPFEKQIQKALSTITHNINIQCEVLDERFRHRWMNLKIDFNKRIKEQTTALKIIKSKYKIPEIKIYPKNEPSKLNIEMDNLVLKLADKKEFTITEAQAIIAHYIK